MDPIDDLLWEGEPRVFPIAVDDVRRASTCGGGNIMVKASKQSYAAILGALEEGHVRL